MSFGDRLLMLAILVVSGCALSVLVVGSGFFFIGSPILRRRRTRPIRMRDYPAWENWLAKHYPKATKDEAEVIRRVVEAIARDARVQPEQLLPEDRLSGFVLPSAWEYFIGTDGESDLSLEMEDLLEERSVPLKDQAVRSDEPQETVGDSIEYMLKRLCPSSQRSGYR